MVGVGASDDEKKIEQVQEMNYRPAATTNENSESPRDHMPDALWRNAVRVQPDFNFKSGGLSDKFPFLFFFWEVG